MIAFAAPAEKYPLLPDKRKQEEYEILTHIPDIDVLASRLRDARHYTQIIVDISLFRDNTPEEIVKALFLLKSSNSTNLTVMAQGLGNNKVIDGLIRNGVYNLVLSYGTDRAKRELADCLEGKRTYESVREYLQDAEPDEKRKKNLPRQNIAVIGVCPRIGTTTQALRIVRSLTEEGNAACLIERDAECFRLIRDVFQEVTERSLNEYVYAGIPICDRHTPDTDLRYNCRVTDFGVFSPDELELYRKCDRRIIVAGSKAWEILKLPEVREVAEKLGRTSYLFSFTSQEERDDIMDFMGEAWPYTFFAEYTPDPFRELSVEEKAMYEKLFRDPKQSKFALARWVGKKEEAK